MKPNTKRILSSWFFLGGGGREREGPGMFLFILSLFCTSVECKPRRDWRGCWWWWWRRWSEVPGRADGVEPECGGRRRRGGAQRHRVHRVPGVGQVQGHQSVAFTHRLHEDFSELPGLGGKKVSYLLVQQQLLPFFQCKIFVCQPTGTGTDKLHTGWIPKN